MLSGCRVCDGIFLCIRCRLGYQHPSIRLSVCVVEFYVVSLIKFMHNLFKQSFDGWTGDNQNSHQKTTAGKTVQYERANGVKVPKIYWEFSRTAVLTMEWIDGIKLTDEIGLRKACLNRQKLIDQVSSRNFSVVHWWFIINYFLALNMIIQSFCKCIACYFSWSFVFITLIPLYS